MWGRQPSPSPCPAFYFFCAHVWHALTILRNIKGRSFCLVLYLVPLRLCQQSHGALSVAAPWTSSSNCFVLFKRGRWMHRGEPGASTVL